MAIISLSPTCPVCHLIRAMQDQPAWVALPLLEAAATISCGCADQRHNRPLLAHPHTPELPQVCRGYEQAVQGVAS